MRHLNKAALTIGLIAAAVWAQPPDTFTVETRLVPLYVSVMDKAGKLITNLGQDQFKVFENNVEQRIKLFRREDIPVSMAIVIDNSGSMRNKRQKVEASALALVKASNPQDEVAIVNFNDDAFLDVPFTNDIKKMEGDGLSQINSRGGTALRDAVSMTLDYVKSEGKKDKKVIVIITDGDDTASTGITQEKLVEKCHKMPDVLVYAIGILGEEDKHSASRAKRALEQMAKASGGASYFPDTAANVEQLTLQVAHDIRNQYVIAYSPLNQVLDGTFRSVKVVAAGGKFSVRTRNGYYATPEEKKRVSASPPVK